MLIYRDLLDAKLRDTFRREIGRVDGVVAELREGAPPRVVHLEAGGTVAWRRAGRLLERLNRAMRRWGAHQTEPARFPWELVEHGDDCFRVRTDADRTPAMAFESWLRENLVNRIPLNGRKR
jgi:hypothetical protein